ncbi:hypothetical protein C1H46_025472 [Malus baccata]|uniref:Major facilitator superfamily (MFS) profile domain-containing protein n=1 Tax=Malus baccata TaxID=106549 RepID=A0A540LR89_MALBA|nr:hypothetical protein C1H46_025472 [Malus baccata]
MADRRAEENAVTGGPQNTSIEDFDPPMKPKTSKFAIACALLACTTSVLLGYDIGVMSGASLYIQKNLKISDVQVEVLAGLTLEDFMSKYENSTCCFSPQTQKHFASLGIFFTSISQVFVNVGILLGYIANYAFSKLPLHLAWRFMLGVGGVPAIFLTAVDIHIFEQVSGIDTVFLYSPRIFDKAGITSSNHKLLATVAVGFTKTVFILVATFFLDKFRQHPLILTSVGRMVFSLMFLEVGLTIVNHHKGSVP